MNKREHILNGALLSVGLAVALAFNGLHTAVLPDITIEVIERLGQAFESSESTVEITKMAATLPVIGLPVMIGVLLPDIDTEYGTHRKTMHNVPFLALIIAFPVFFANLHHVWVGVASHYLLDMLGSNRGIALFCPFSGREFSIPIDMSRAGDTLPVVIISALQVLAFAVFISF